MDAPGFELDSASALAVPPGEVEAELARILASAGFRKSQRRSALLHWLVMRAVDHDAHPVKEYEIGVAVFGKPESWDPHVDSAVRVEFNRVRGKLREFYEEEGAEDPILIDFPARGYAPVFTRRAPAIAPAADPASLTNTAVDLEIPLEPVPERRRVSARWVAAAAGLCLAILGFGWHFLPIRPIQQPLSSIAVLPFLDLSANHQDEYLSDGFTDELTNAVALLEGLRVVARTSAFRFKGKSVDVREIGRELGVGAVLEGSVLRTGNAIRVVAQLNRTTDGMHIWASTYDRQVKDLLRVQDEISESIAEALRVRLAGRPAPEFDPGAEALDEYLQGTYQEGKATPAALQLAAGHYQNALRLAPRYTLAYVRLGSVHLGLAGMTGPAQRAELEQARHNLEVALSLDPGLPMANAALALVNYVLDWNWPAAEAAFRRALALGARSSSTAHQTYAWGLMTRGRFREAEQQYREAIELDPLNPLEHYNLAMLFMREGRPKEARHELESWVNRNPEWFTGSLYLGYISLYEHQPDQAMRHLERAATLAADKTMIDPFLAMAYAEGGQRARAGALMRQIENHVTEKAYVAFQLALVSAFLGDTSKLFYWLGQSVEHHEQQALNMRIEPALAPYQQDPRMIALQRRMGLLSQQPPAENAQAGQHHST